MRHTRLACALAFLSLGGCLPDLKATDVTVADAEGKDTAQLCQNALDRENPFIVEWPGTHKVELESISKRGLAMTVLLSA